MIQRFNSKQAFMYETALSAISICMLSHTHPALKSQGNKHQQVQQTYRLMRCLMPSLSHRMTVADVVVTNANISKQMTK